MPVALDHNNVTVRDRLAKRGDYLRFDIFAPHLVTNEDGDKVFVMQPIIEDGEQVAFHTEAEAEAYIEAGGADTEDAVVVVTTKRIYRRREGGRLDNPTFDPVPLPALLPAEAVVEAPEAVTAPDVAVEAPGFDIMLYGADEQVLVDLTGGLGAFLTGV